MHFDFSLLNYDQHYFGKKKESSASWDIFIIIIISAKHKHEVLNFEIQQANKQTISINILCCYSHDNFNWLFKDFLYFRSK